jgi:hypothetical protein
MIHSLFYFADKNMDARQTKAATSSLVHVSRGLVPSFNLFAAAQAHGSAAQSLGLLIVAGAAAEATAGAGAAAEATEGAAAGAGAGAAIDGFFNWFNFCNMPDFSLSHSAGLLTCHKGHFFPVASKCLYMSLCTVKPYLLHRLAQRSIRALFVLSLNFPLASGWQFSIPRNRELLVFAIASHCGPNDLPACQATSLSGMQRIISPDMSII